MVTGILVLGNVFSSNAFFRNNEFLRLAFGFILILYGAYRGLNTYFKIKEETGSIEKVSSNFSFADLK
jgi:hypothetical protein